ncbi:MAG: hypothetical protein IAI49_14765 [Candidatus Eremiobacteraeota bacterium]|nr:hypothetical protein [Candidatus Eremiobacteraeota bacterium]
MIAVWAPPHMQEITLAFWQHLPLYVAAEWFVGYFSHLMIMHTKLERIEDVRDMTDAAGR